uniref:uncharacterized protein n=1 Tax=Myxine glutinosa TaxID=7769 RepID=UPI00358F023F
MQLVSACRLRAQYPSSGEVLELTTACHQVWEAARETLPCLLHPTPPIDYEGAAVSGLVQDVRWLAGGLEDEGDLWDTSGAAEEAVAERSRAVCNLACALCLQSRGQSKSEAFPELPVLAKAFTKECRRLCETLTSLSTKLTDRKEWSRVLADLRRVPRETSENESDGTLESTEAIPSLQAARQALSALLPALRRARTLQDQVEGRLPCPSSPRPARKTQDSVGSATAPHDQGERKDRHIRLLTS